MTRSEEIGQTTQVDSGEPQRLFAEALALHRASRLTEAGRVYQRVLEIDPTHADSLHLLGVIAHQSGHHDVAAALIEKAIAQNDKVAAYHSNLGLARSAQGRIADAIRAYQRVLAAWPDFAEAHNNLGNALGGHGAATAAQECYRRALITKPDYPEAHNNLGNALKGRERPAEAETCYRRALAQRPDYAEAYSNLGSALLDQERVDEAIVACEQALARRPDLAEAHDRRGTALAKRGRLQTACESFVRAVSSRPDYAEAHSDLGVALKALGRDDDALAAYRHALVCQPDFAVTHANLAIMQAEQGSTEAAILSYRRALLTKPDYAAVHAGLATLLLLTGRFDEGWEEYEWRWQTAEFRPTRREFPQPLWQGEAIDGRTILLYAEQGVGDALQFCRYAPLVAARGGRVVLEVQASLRRLVNGMAGIRRVVAYGDRLPTFDLHCPLMSLPRLFGTRLATIPATVPYLTANPHRVAAWQARLPSVGLRIGLAWQGNPDFHHDGKRSIAPALFAPLIALSATLPLHFVSLQKEGPVPPADWPLIDVMAEMEDFADTAALIVALDLVICVDTAVAHLAGALNRPVWLLNRVESDWRWLQHCADSPWYPSMRVFRQSFDSDWTGVIADVAEALIEFANESA